MELKIIEVNRSKEGNEYILLQSEKVCNLHDFLIHDQTYDADGNTSNLQPHMYRFLSKLIGAGEYVALFTQGEHNKYRETSYKKSICHIICWGLDHDIWNDCVDRATLLKIAGEHKKRV